MISRGWRSVLTRSCNVSSLRACGLFENQEEIPGHQNCGSFQQTINVILESMLVGRQAKISLCESVYIRLTVYGLNGTKEFWKWVKLYSFTLKWLTVVHICYILLIKCVPYSVFLLIFNTLMHNVSKQSNTIHWEVGH